MLSALPARQAPRWWFQLPWHTVITSSPCTHHHPRADGAVLTTRTAILTPLPPALLSLHSLLSVMLGVIGAPSCSTHTGSLIPSLTSHSLLPFSEVQCLGGWESRGRFHRKHSADVGLCCPFIGRAGCAVQASIGVKEQEVPVGCGCEGHRSCSSPLCLALQMPSVPPTPASSTTPGHGSSPTT